MIARVVAAALPVAAVTLSVAALAIVGAWLRWLPPLAGLGIFTLALLGGGLLSLLLGLARLWAAGGAEHASRSGGLIAATIGLGCLVTLVVLASAGAGAPRIHDVTTDLDDPPAFVVAVGNAANRGRDLSYPNGAGETPRLQRDGYPDLAPIALEVDADAAYRAAVAAAEGLGWRIVARDAERRTFEAEDQTAVFRFTDDVVVRVRADGDGAVVDVRSLSRLGVGDLGVNAGRIRDFRDALSGR